MPFATKRIIEGEVANMLTLSIIKRSVAFQFPHNCGMKAEWITQTMRRLPEAKRSLGG